LLLFSHQSGCSLPPAVAAPDFSACASDDADPATAPTTSMLLVGTRQNDGCLFSLPRCTRMSFGLHTCWTTHLSLLRHERFQR
jgi:hypothetical protein